MSYLFKYGTGRSFCLSGLLVPLLRKRVDSVPFNILDMVKKACEQNFTKRGEYFFEYSIIGDEVIVKELILERKQRDEIRGKKTIGRKILTIGGSVVLLGVIAACSAL